MRFIFTEILDTLNNRLSAVNGFKDVLFHSTYQRLLDVIAYMSEKVAYMAEYYYRESSWRSARNRSSLLDQSYLLNYTPHRKSGASGPLLISHREDFSEEATYGGASVFLSKYTQFTDENKELTVYLTQDVTYLRSRVGPLPVTVNEGVPKVYTYTATGEDRETITIFSDSIDNDVIELNIIDDVTGEVLYPVTIIEDPYFVNDLTNYYCQIENASDFTYINIIFGDNRYTRTLIQGQLIEIKYADTLGDKGNIEGVNLIRSTLSQFKDSQGNNVELFVTNPESISDGRDYESLRSIRSNGRRLFFAGFRAASEADWRSIIESTPFVQRAKIWTKTDLGQPATGLDQNIVYISAVSNSGDSLTGDQQNTIIFDYLLPAKCPTDVISFEPLQKVYVRFDSRINATNVPEVQIRNEVNDQLEVYNIANMDFAEDIFFSNYTSLVDQAESVLYHDTVGWYVEKQDDSGKPFSIFKYNYTLRPTKSGDPLYPNDSQYSESDINKQILLVPGEFEIWIKRKVGDQWFPPTKIGRADDFLETIRGVKYIALNDIQFSVNDPSVNDDETSEDIYLGKIWKNTNTNNYFECTDQTAGAAVWINLNTTSNGLPTVNTDETLGFYAGAVWYDSASDNFFQCIDSTPGNALWQVRNNVLGFGSGDTDSRVWHRSFTWSLTGTFISYSTNIISYEIRTIFDDVTTYGVVNPTETDEDGFIVFLSYRMQDGNGLQNKDIRLGGFAQILDFDRDLNTFSIVYKE